MVRAEPTGSKTAEAPRPSTRYDVSKYLPLSACIHGPTEDGTSSETFSSQIASSGALASDG